MLVVFISNFSDYNFNFSSSINLGGMHFVVNYILVIKELI